jgi:hypothetical protein
MIMYQFLQEDMAFQAARFLAAYERQPIAVMARGRLMNFFTIGPINNAVVHEAGRHMATVYRSGRIDHMGLASASCSPKWEHETRWESIELSDTSPLRRNLVLR